MIEIVSGDDDKISITLTKGGVSFPISNGAIVKAAIVDRGHSKLLAGPFAVSQTEVGSDWQNSLIVVKLPGQFTESLSQDSKAGLEIEVNDGGKLTWFSELTITKGQIR